MIIRRRGIDNMLRVIYIKAGEVKMGPYLTSAQVNDLVKKVILALNLPQDSANYSDSRIHAGTECSNIYKALFPTAVKQDELGYIKATQSTIDCLKSGDIAFNLKPLKQNGKETDKGYIQLISLDIVSIYLGKLNLPDNFIKATIETLSMHSATLKIPTNQFIAGNKPVDIEGKPLVKILKQGTVDKQLKDKPVDLLDLGKGLAMNLDNKCSMEYVKTSTLLRHDIYIALKAIASKSRKPVYQIIEELLLHDSDYTLTMLPGGM